MKIVDFKVIKKADKCCGQHPWLRIMVENNIKHFQMICNICGKKSAAKLNKDTAIDKWNK